MVPAEGMERNGAAVFANKANFSISGNFSDGSQTHAEVTRGDFLGIPARNREKKFVIVAAVKSERKRVEAASAQVQVRRNGNGRNAVQ